jgi:hypothetical protein
VALVLVIVVARFEIVTACVFSVEPPSLSMIRLFTVYVPGVEYVHCVEALLPDPRRWPC